MLVMEFIDGVQVNDCRAIQKLGVQPSDVSKLVSLCTSSINFSMMMPKVSDWSSILVGKLSFHLASSFDKIFYTH